MHEDLVPPDDIEGMDDKETLDFATEYDVLEGLRYMGHEAQPLGLSDNLGKVREAIAELKPHVAFNLLEEFHGVAVYDQHVVSYLELMKLPYTGCNPRGLMLAHDKGLCKQILSYHRISTPKFALVPQGRRPRIRRGLQYPLLVKSAIEEASLGIAQASVVHSEEKLVERVRFVHEQLGTDALVEEYIEGRELYVGVLGNSRLVTLPVWEMLFTKMPDNVPRIATAKVKWDLDYQAKVGVRTQAATNIPDALLQRIQKLCKRVYRALSLSGYARMDLRLTDDGRIYVLEANPNPYLADGEDFAESAHKAGMDYPALLHRILNLGLSYKAAWRV